MGITERKERERQEVRTKILDAARELFAREGYEAVTMRRVAEAIEYSPTAIYLHFADKETLIRELCLADFAAFAKVFHQIAKEPDPIKRIRKSGQAYVSFGLQHPNHYRLMFMTPRQTPAEASLKHKMDDPELDAYAFLRSCVAEGIQAECFREELTDPDLVAQVLWAVTHGVVSLHIAQGSHGFPGWRGAEAIARTAIDANLAGLTRQGK